MGKRYPEPQKWLFNDDDRRRYAGVFWQCPVRLA
jgi:hypothetical protein